MKKTFQQFWYSIEERLREQYPNWSDIKMVRDICLDCWNQQDMNYNEASKADKEKPVEAVKAESSKPKTNKVENNGIAEDEMSMLFGITE